MPKKHWRKYIYVCGICKKPRLVGESQHHRIKAGERNNHCNKCYQMLRRELRKAKEIKRIAKPQRFGVECPECHEVRYVRRRQYLGLLKKPTPCRGCSNRQRVQWGEKNVAWKGGRTKLSKAIRNTRKYEKWRERCLERDDHACQECGVPAEEVHHLKQFIDIIQRHKVKTTKEATRCEELWDLSNGVSLCKNHHEQIHS